MHNYYVIKRVTGPAVKFAIKQQLVSKQVMKWNYAYSEVL